MSPTEAARILELPADATPDQVEARFHELRTKLEVKIGKAPTPGLKAKYRETLDEITAAFETLALAADSSALPVLKREQGGGRKEKESGAETGGGKQEAGGSGPAPSSFHPAPATRRKSGSEFLVVALIAVVVLGAGGWFIMKTRAESAEKARLAAEAQVEKDRQAAEAKAEQERLAQITRHEAEEKRQAEETERARQEKLLAQLRGDLAEAKIAWEAIEREERAAERQLAELKSDLRSLRDPPAGKLAEAQALVAAQQDYYDWLSDTLARHPARIARGRAEELLSARQADDAQAALQDFFAALRALEAEIPRQRQALLDLDGELNLQTNPETTWTLTDAFGRVHRGQGPAQLNQVAVGLARLEASAPVWGERRASVQISRSRAATLDAVFRGATLRLASEPAGATVVDRDGRTLGVTPLEVPNLQPITHRFTLNKPDFYPAQVEVSMTSEAASRTVKLRAHGTGLNQPAKWRHPARVRVETSSQSVGNPGWRTGTVEEWDFSAPNAGGDWTLIERHIITATATGLPATVRSGSVIRYQHGADGQWTSRFLRGGVTDQVYAASYGAFIYNPEMYGLSKCWPPDSVEVGGTWPIEATDVPGMGSLPKVSGQATGKLLSADHPVNPEWATLEISYDLAWQSGDAPKIPIAGSIRIRINLSEGYVAEYDTRWQSSGTELSTTTRMTKR